MYGFLDDAEIEENIRNMRESAAYATCLKVFKSVKNTRFGDTEILKGEYFVALKNRILSSKPVLVDAVISGIRTLNLSEKGNMSIYYKDGFDKSQAEKIENEMFDYPQLR